MSVGRAPSRMLVRGASRLCVLVAAAPVLLCGVSACSAVRDVVARASSAPTATGPPPAASQPPGPPLATASPLASAPLDPHDPGSVAVDCFTRWQSYDTRADSGPDAGLLRVRTCMTPDFFAQLGGERAATATEEPARGWLELRELGSRSTVEVLATSPLGGVDSTASGRVVLLLNVRRTTVSDRVGDRVETVSNPALTLLRQTDGTWLVAGADLANSYGDAPGR
ncbi:MULTISPECIES: hypothetical protein [Protofrankia]|nr:MULTISPECIES: hypothetical protein [Protofrankia]